MAKQASTKQMSLMLGYDNNTTQLVLKAFYSRRDVQELESNVELTKLLFLAIQADRIGGLRVYGDSKTKSGPKPQRLVTLKHRERSHVSEIPPSKPFTYFDTLP